MFAEGISVESDADMGYFLESRPRESMDCNYDAVSERMSIEVNYLGAGPKDPHGEVSSIGKVPEPLR